MKKFISLAIIAFPLILFSQVPGIIWENMLPQIISMHAQILFQPEYLTMASVGK